jgi:hypothetical protein
MGKVQLIKKLPEKEVARQEEKYTAQLMGARYMLTILGAMRKKVWTPTRRKK